MQILHVLDLETSTNAFANLRSDSTSFCLEKPKKHVLRAITGFRIKYHFKRKNPKKIQKTFSLLSLFRFGHLPLALSAVTICKATINVACSTAYTKISLICLHELDECTPHPFGVLNERCLALRFGKRIDFSQFLCHLCLLKIQ